MSSPAASPVPSAVDEAERLRKEAKKARKAEKKAAEAAAASAAAAAAPPAAKEESAMEDNEETEEERKARKAAKKAKKAAALEAAAQAALTASAPAHAGGAAAAAAAASPLLLQRKNYYKQHSEVASLSSKAVAAVRAESKMTLNGNMYGKEALYHPVSSFAQAGFSKQLLTCTAGFKAPTAIQAQCWPVLLMGRDAIAIAETGSGTLHIACGCFELRIVRECGSLRCVPTNSSLIQMRVPLAAVVAPF
jgi:ATP-dependent RNA helicase DBP3